MICLLLKDLEVELIINYKNYTYGQFKSEINLSV